jgi:hypothetical protein
MGQIDIIQNTLFFKFGAIPWQYIPVLSFILDNWLSAKILSKPDDNPALKLSNN